MREVKETVLYYNPIPSDKVIRLKGVLVQMGIRIKNITREQSGQTVGYLAGMKGFEETEVLGELPVIEEEILIMKDFSGTRMDQLLLSLRKAGVERIALKAVVTESNSKWTLNQLYREIKEEHEKMSTKQ